MSTNGMVLEFDYSGCFGAGAPRFVIYFLDISSNLDWIPLGCAAGDVGGGHVRFEQGQTYGGELFDVVTVHPVFGIQIIMDEEGQVTLSNVMVNGVQVVAR